MFEIDISFADFSDGWVIFLMNRNQYMNFVSGVCMEPKIANFLGNSSFPYAAQTR